MKNKAMDFTFKYGSLIVIALIILFLSFWDEHFFTYSNLTDILRSISIVTFVAIGVTFSLTVDGFDLSCRLHGFDYNSGRFGFNGLVPAAIGRRYCRSIDDRSNSWID